MIKIAICDDDKSIGSQIENILIKYTNEHFIKTETEVFFSGEELISHIKNYGNFDLIYLDIEMGEINGIDVGHFIRKELRDYQTEIVYISGANTYDRKLFDVQPLHFIPKPINPQTVIDDFNLALDRGKRVINHFTYAKGSIMKKVPIDEILYFESFNREIHIVLEHDEDDFYGTLEDTVAKVSEFGFVRIHRSYLVNFEKAISVSYDEIEMPNGKVLPISRTKRAEIRNLQLELY